MSKLNAAAVAAMVAAAFVAGCLLATTPHFGPYVTNVTGTSAEVLWVTPKDAASSQVVVAQGPNAAIKVKTTTQRVDSRMETLHIAKVTGLAAGKSYDYMMQFNPPFQTVGSRSGNFRTDPGPDADAPLHFAVYGDTRTYPDRHKLVATALDKEGPLDFVVQSGDLVADGRKWPLWKKQFFDPAQEMLRHTTIWPVLGNHEYDGILAQQLFDFPKSYHSIDFGNVHFVLLNSELKPGKADPEMLAWLEKDLAASKATWKLVSYHRPTFDVITHRTTFGQRDLLPVLQRGGVDIVMNGHTHNYQRFRPIGDPGQKPVIFCVSAGGGAPNYAVNPGPILEKAYSGLNYCVFDVKGNTLEMTAKYPDGKTLDHLKLVKTDGMYQKEVMDRAISTDFARQAAFLLTGFFAHSPTPPAPGQLFPLFISPLSFPEGAEVEVGMADIGTPKPGEIINGVWTIPPVKLTGFKATPGVDEDHTGGAVFTPLVMMVRAPADVHFTDKGALEPPIRISVTVHYKGQTYTNHNTGVYFRTLTLKSWQAQRDAWAISR